MGKGELIKCQESTLVKGKEKGREKGKDLREKLRGKEVTI